MFRRDIEQVYSGKIVGYLLKGYSIVAAMLSFGTVYLANGNENEMIRVTLRYYFDDDEDGYEITEEKVIVSKASTTFMFDNVECLHKTRYRDIRDKDDNIKCYENK